MRSPAPASARARLAALTRHRPTDDPAVIDARRAVRFSYARRNLADLSRHLTDVERAELAAVLLTAEAS